MDVSLFSNTNVKVPYTYVKCFVEFPNHCISVKIIGVTAYGPGDVFLVPFRP